MIDDTKATKLCKIYKIVHIFLPHITRKYDCALLREVYKYIDYHINVYIMHKGEATVKSTVLHNLKK